MEIPISLRRYLLEIFFIIFIIFLIILYFIFANYIANLLIFLGSILANLTFLIISVREKKEKERKYTVIIDKIEELLQTTHTFQQGNNLKNLIYEKFDNLKNNYEKELKEINCLFENILDSRAFIIYLNEDKIIVQPGYPIIRESKGSLTKIRLKDYDDIRSLIKEIKKEHMR